MKKLIQIFVAVVILSTCQSAHAGINKTMSPIQSAPQDTSSVRVNFIGVHPLCGGCDVAVTIVVLDINNRPIQGATVSAPCTGQANKLTDNHGIATWSVGPTCPCNEDAVTVTTKTCYQQIHANCGTYTVVCNQ